MLWATSETAGVSDPGSACTACCPKVPELLAGHSLTLGGLCVRTLAWTLWTWGRERSVRELDCY